MTTYSYDVYQRLTGTTNPRNGTTALTYDAADRLLTLRDPVNNTTTWTYLCPCQLPDTEFRCAL